MKYTRKLRGGQNNLTNRRNRVRAMMNPHTNTQTTNSTAVKPTGFTNTMRRVRNAAGQKIRNVRQTLKNKYNVMKTNAMLENNFYYRPNVAGTAYGSSANAKTLERGYGSRNLISQANRQHQYIVNRNRRRREAEERRRQAEEQRKKERNSELYTKATVARNAASFFF